MMLLTDMDSRQTHMAGIVKAKRGETVYYFSGGGIIVATAYSQKLFWAVLFAVYFIVWGFTGFGGAIGGLIIGAIVSEALELAVAIPKIKKWDGMTSRELQSEKGVRVLSWGDVSKAVYKAPSLLEIYIGEKRTRMKIITNIESAKAVFEARLGSRFEVA